MTGLPIAEVLHSRNTIATTSQIHIPPSQRQIQNANTELPSEPLIAAVNLSSKYTSGITGRNVTQLNAAKYHTGIDVSQAAETPSLNVLSDFQPSCSVTQKVLGTTVNPLLMPLPTLEAKPLNVAFPPTQNLLQTSSKIQTQSVETSGLIQAGSPLTGITSLNSDSLTIRITNVPTETTEQGK